MENQKVVLNFDDLLTSVQVEKEKKKKNKKNFLKRSLTKEYLLAVDAVEFWGFSGIGICNLSKEDFDEKFQKNYELLKESYVFENVIKEFGTESFFIDSVKKEILHTYYKKINKNWPTHSKTRSMVSLIEKMFKFKKDKSDLLDVRCIDKEDIHVLLDNFVVNNKGYKAFVMKKMLLSESSPVLASIIYLVFGMFVSMMGWNINISSGSLALDLPLVILINKILSMIRYRNNVSEEELRSEFVAYKNNIKLYSVNKFLTSKPFKSKESTRNTEGFINDDMAYRRIVTPFDVWDVYKKEEYEKLSYTVFFPATSIEDLFNKKENYMEFQEKSANLITEYKRNLQQTLFL